MPDIPVTRTAELWRSAGFAALLLRSHLEVTGTPLCPPRWSSHQEAARWLYASAPFGLLAHDTDDDPKFFYANQAAQSCFGYGWDEFDGMPSRLSAASDRQTERESFVQSVRSKGFATGYRGLRRARSGSEFWIEDVTMWDLIDESGTLHGQAAVFRSWSEHGEG
ncbi:MEKHLA domain-containing protein [Streptomyces sp. AK02-01A]|uniref:MEKHLA domain-containing protein n=1 Tax=Streptomyces sp. AK02-01A TaxID=3028648 RepID=UPI0029B95858|nr:MEKHLA domain-containing protein [Streptomyces sp. AK02-01A]MDX3855212.1 MEKHLA domain-containing protein [Streptomyces sp. AK02-01A]